MDAETYHFQIGDFNCIAINDGTHSYTNPAGLFFANAPEEQLVTALNSYGITHHEWKEHKTPFTCLLVKTHQNIVLIDTGAGSGLEPGLGKLPILIQKEGIPLEAIDTVLISHGHPDHIGGNTSSDGSVNFPNARFMISNDEWEFWSSEKSLAEEGFFTRMVRKNLLAISDRFICIKPDAEIVPGIQAVAAPGHTPGHLVISLCSRGQQLLSISDAVLHPLQIENPEWYSLVDVEPDQMVRTRVELIRKGAEEHIIMLAFHFPFPGVGYIYKEGDGYRWKPET